MQTISATTGSWIVESDLKIVVAQEPIEGGPRFFAPAALACCAVRFQTCRDGPACFYGLLVEASFFRLPRIKALRADRHKMTFHFATLNRGQPIQRFKPCRNHVLIRGSRPRPNQGLW